MPSGNAGKTHTLLKIKWKAHKATLVFEDEEIVVSEDVFTDYRLYEGKEVGNVERNKIRNDAKLSSLYSYGLGLVSHRSYTVHEVREKLKAKTEDVEEIRKVIYRLKQLGFLDDEAYMSAYVEEALSVKAIGETRIRFELEKKGIHPEVLQNLRIDPKKEKEAAERYLNVLNSRYKNVPNRQKKIKAANALIARGFDHALAEEVSQKLLPTSSKEEAKRLSVDYNKAKQRYAQKYRGYELKKRVVGSLLKKGYDYEDIKELTEEDSYEND